MSTEISLSSSRDFITSGFKTVSKDYTLAIGDEVILVDGKHRVTLPRPNRGLTGQCYTIKRIGVADIVEVISPEEDVRLDGEISKALSSQYASIGVATDGKKWYVLSESGHVT